MNYLQLDTMRESNDGPGLIAQLQDLCTWLCVGGEQYVHQFEVFPYTAALLPLVNFPNGQVQILALRALALEVEQVPRGVSAVTKDNGIPILLDKAAGLDFMDPVSEAISEELIKILAVLSNGAHKAMVLHNAIPVVLSLATTVPNETSRYSCYNCVCAMVSVCTPDNFDVLIEAMVHVVDVLSDKVGFLVRLRSSAKEGQANSQQNARAIADEQIVLVVVRCLCHLLDRIGLSQAQMDELLDNSVVSPTIPLLLSVLEMTSLTHGDGVLKRAVLSFFTTVFQSAPRSLLNILNHAGGWNAVVSCVTSMANGNARHSSHAAPDAASLTGIAFTTSAAAQSSAANSGRTSGLDASLEQDTNNLALLDFLLLVLPADQPNETIILTRPYHVWSWEDDFHNTVEYDDAISWRLEREYQRQRAVGRFIPCEVVHMIRYFVSFERMRQLTPQGALSRTVMRSPILSHFLHTRSAANMTCTCQSAYSNNNSFSVHPAATTSHQMTPRAAPKEEKPGWFSSMFGCCCTSDAVKEAPRRRKNRDSMISALDASAPLSIFRFAETQLELQETMADALDDSTALVNLFHPILHVAQRTANPLILRHCCTILSRLLGLVIRNGPAASDAVPGSTASEDSDSGRRGSGSVVPPDFLVEIQEDLVRVFAYSISVCATSQTDRLLAVMSAKDLAAEGFEDTSTVPVHNYLASPTAPNENDPLSMVVTFSVLGDLLVSACGAVNHLVALLGSPIAKRFTSQGTATDLAFLGKQIQTTPGVADQHCPRHSSKLFTLRTIMDAIHATYSTMQEATDNTHRAPANMGVQLPASPTLALPAYTVTDANASSGAFSTPEDDTCPSALQPVWRLYKESEEGGALEASTSGDGCLVCAAVEALKMGGVTLGGTKVASGRQALADYIASKDASVFRLGLQRFTVRLMMDISNKLPLSGTFVADSYNISKGPKALNHPNSITAAVLMEKALKPIGLRILPLGDTHPSDDPTPPTLSIPGYTPLPLLTIPKAIKEFTLHTFAFATVSQIAEEIATRYNDSIETAFPGMLQRAHDDWITESISTMHDAVSTSASHHNRRRSTNASRDPNDETDTLHPNRFPNSADSSSSTPMISTSSPVPEEITPSPPQWPSINAKQVLLFINRVPILDRSMSFLDALLRNELTAGGMRRLLESVPSQYNRALVQQALSLWGHTYRLTFVVLESPLDMNALPSEHGCHCGSSQEPTLSPVDITSSAAAAASAPNEVTPETPPVATIPNQITVRPPTALYKVDQLPVCSPWHLFADKDLQDHWVCDALRLLEQLIDLVVTPFDPTMLVGAGQRLYSVLLHNCKMQTIAFTLPALSHLVHPSIRPLQHALSPSTPRGAEGLAEYILWNHPSILPLPVRILYFNHISGVRGSATTKGANKGGGGRVVGGGGWVLPIRNRNQPSPKKIKVTVRRDTLLTDAEEVLTTYALCPLPLDIEFEGEPGSGVGPTIEFFSLVARELTAYSSEMWSSEADGLGINSPSPASPTVPKVPSNDEVSENTSFTEREKSSLVYDEKAEKRHQKEQYASGRLFPRFPPTPRGIRNFALLGHLIARGLQDGRTMNMWLHPVFLDRLLGKSMKPDSRYDGSVSNLLPSRASIGSIGSVNVPGGISTRHLSHLMTRVDPPMEQSLQRLLAMSEEELAVMDIVFTVPGTDDRVQLCEGGLEIAVTQNNVAQYCDAVRQVLCCTSVDIPARTVLEGLNRSSIIPGHMRLFTGPEFEVLLSGHRGKVWATEEQLRRDVTCAHGYNTHSKAIQFFITAVVSFSAELQRRFLLFISGSDCLPAGGLNPPIQVVRKGLDPEASPIRKRRIKSGAVSPALSPSLLHDNQSEGDISSSTSTPPTQHLTPHTLIPLTLPAANLDLGSGDSTSASPLSSARSNQTITVSIGIGTKALTLEGEEEVEIRLTTQEQVDECLPTVNTCFHYLKLPDYSSEEVLKNRLLVAVYEGQGTFQLS